MAVVDPFPDDPEDFGTDDRVSFDQVSQTHKLEDENGREWEWLARPKKWVPVLDEAELEAQQQAYRVAGVDENAPAIDLKKRKAGDDENVSDLALVIRKDAEKMKGFSNGKAKKLKAEEQSAEPKKNNAVYITSLPEDTTEEELHQTFSKFGVIAESADSDKPRIKMYQDEEGKFKGDALIVYFRPESVQLAINMLDETDFRLGHQLVTGPMRVREADSSFKAQKDKPLSGEHAKVKGTGANRDRKKVIRKNQEMNSRLADWDDDDPSQLPDTSSRWDKVVVLKHMFTLAELKSDPAALLDIKEDVREECEKLGKVTNVVLYDKEEDGVVTVRFGNSISAQACVKLFDGRWFDERQIEAYIADGKERFLKSKRQDDDDEERLESFSNFIETGGGDP